MSSKRPLGRMLISQADNREIDIDIEKVSRGSFYTTQSNWLNAPVQQFLKLGLEPCDGSVLDPFAGDGHLLDTISQNTELSHLVKQTKGLDLLGNWPVNDSLFHIPNPDNSLILTNPPYLANHSAKRKGVDSLVQKYFQQSGQDNLYKVALTNSLAAAEYVVAIIPETFLLSTFPKDRLSLAVVIQDALFLDTDAPALVACFGPDNHAEGLVYVGNKLVAPLAEILALRFPSATGKKKIIFNDPEGQIGLRAVDGSDGKTPIEFLRATDFEYKQSKVLVSSRLMTYISIPGLSQADSDFLIQQANLKLGRIREASKDLVLAPFKGNDREGKRRRRLDYALARRILNSVLERLSSN